jgi:single-stranded DNA-binding protein
MGNLNRTILTGRLTSDPEVRYTTNEIPVASFSLAISRPTKRGTEPEGIGQDLRRIPEKGKAHSA